MHWISFQVENVWNLCSKDRWRLYRRWVYDACEMCHKKIAELQVSFDEEARNLKYLREVEDKYVLSKADVIGMTTNGNDLMSIQKIEGCWSSIGLALTTFMSQTEIKTSAFCIPIFFLAWAVSVSSLQKTTAFEGENNHQSQLLENPPVTGVAKYNKALDCMGGSQNFQLWQWLHFSYTESLELTRGHYQFYHV